ncbi:hypothetical protein K492DRAFT_210368 [Lichtheimia hyalospora FSU 10163]|nr:hypothetical protein K492DRAFT_210368 [Lichtheimia hyalospora FSU 10163]
MSPDDIETKTCHDQQSQLSHEIQYMSPDDMEAKTCHEQPITFHKTDVIANPGPLGLCGLALTCFVLSLHNAGAGVSSTGPNNVVTGLALFYGGMIQVLCGMWEFKTGNTFGATAFASYGAYWLSYSVISMPWSGIPGAYSAADPSQLAGSLTIYMIAWAIFSGFMLIASHRSSIGMVLLFFCLFLLYVLTAAAEYNSSVSIRMASGCVGVVTSFVAWYNAFSGLLTKQSSFFQLPIGSLS